MKSTRIIEILNLVKSELYNTENKQGIRTIIIRLNINKIISTSDAKLIFNFIGNNVPTPYNRYKEFTKSKLWLLNKNINPMDSLWWLTNKDHILGNQIRIEYIDKLIQETQKPNILYKIQRYYKVYF